MPDYFNIGAFRDTPSWHGKEMKSGGIFTGDVSIWEIMQSAGMDYTVEKLPIGITLPDGSIIQDGDRWAIMRPPCSYDGNWRNLRVVGNRYDPIQNDELAKILEPLNRNGWPLEGTAVLKEGEIIFVELQVNPFYVAGMEMEEHKAFLLAANDHTSGGLFWGITHVRVVCNNTYTMALAGKGIENIPHTADAKTEMDFRVKLQLAIQKQEERHQKFLEKLFVRKVEKEEVETFFDGVFPTPAVTRKMKVAQAGKDIKKHDFLEIADKDIANYNRRVERTQALRDELRVAFGEFNQQYPHAENTAYALFNSATYVLTHSPSFTGSAEKNAVSEVFGQKNTFTQNALASVAKLK